MNNYFGLRHVLLLILLFVSGQALAAPLPPWKVGIDYQIVAAGFELTPKAPGPTDAKLKYRPANSRYFGVILGYKWLAGTVSFSVPANREIRDEEGTSKYRDYRLAYYVRRFGIEVGYSRYLGYLIDNSNVLSDTTKNGQKYYKDPSLDVLGYGGNFIYVFNPQNYSLPAAIDQSEIQDHSGVSPIAVGTFRQQNIQSIGTIIPLEKQPDFGADATISSAHTQSLGVGLGMAGNWVPSVFFLSGLAALSLGYQHVDYHIQNEDKSFASVGANIHGRVGFGVNARRFLFGITVAGDWFGQQTNTISVMNSSYGVNFAISTRF